jgi:hypothetical protein
MSNAARRALRRLGVPEPVTATKALSVAVSVSRQDQLIPPGPGRIIESLPEHMRDALRDLQSRDISDLRDDYVRPRLSRGRI